MGEFINFVGEEYQVVKKRKGRSRLKRRIKPQKKESGSIIIFPVILRLLGRGEGVLEGNKSR